MRGSLLLLVAGLLVLTKADELAQVKANITRLQQEQHQFLNQLHNAQDQAQQHKDLTTWLIGARSKLQHELLLANTSRAQHQEWAESRALRNSKLTAWIGELKIATEENEKTLKALTFEDLKLKNQFDAHSDERVMLAKRIQELQSGIDRAADLMAVEKISWDKHAHLVVAPKAANVVLEGSIRDHQQLQRRWSIDSHLLDEQVRTVGLESAREQALKQQYTADTDTLTAQYQFLLQKSAGLEGSRNSLLANLTSLRIQNHALLQRKRRLEASRRDLKAQLADFTTKESISMSEKLVTEQHLADQTTLLTNAKQARDTAQGQVNALIGVGSEIKTEACKAKVLDLSARNAVLQNNIAILTQHSMDEIPH